MASLSLKVHNIRLAILNAAYRRFAHFGFAKVTMDEIAGDVGMGKASLYYYFPTKESLCKAVITREQEEFSARIRTLLAQAGLTASEKLRQYVEHRFAYSNRLRQLSLPDLQSSGSMHVMLAQVFQDFATAELGFYRTIFEEGMARKEFSQATPPEVMATTFLHVLQGLRLRLLRGSQGPNIDPEGLTQVHADIRNVTEIVLRSLAAQSRPHHRTAAGTKRPSQHHSAKRS